MGKNISYEVWIERFKAVHGDKYTYGEILPREGQNNRKIEIFCKDHGLFTRYLGKHWRNVTTSGNVGGGECHKCLKIPKRTGYSESDWVSDFKTNQPIKYDYSNAEFLSDKIRVKVECKEHGWFTQTKSTHASGTVGCRGCWTYLKGVEFKKKAEELFPGKFDYSKFVYTDSRDFSTIICKEHGEFQISPNRMLLGKHPCSSCYKVARSELHPGGIGGYTKKVFERDIQLSNQDAEVYYIKIGDYYKIGISTNTHRRLTALKSKSKMEIQVLDKHHCSLYDAYKIEQHVLLTYKDSRVRTKWSAELFDNDVLKDIPLSTIVPTDEILELIP